MVEHTDIVALAIVGILVLFGQILVFLGFLKEDRKSDSARDIWDSAIWHYRGL